MDLGARNCAPLRRIGRSDAAEKPPLACRNFRGVGSELAVASRRAWQKWRLRREFSSNGLAVRIAIENRETVYARNSCVSSEPFQPFRDFEFNVLLLFFYIFFSVRRTAFLLFVRLLRIFARRNASQRRSVHKARNVLMNSVTTFSSCDPRVPDLE